MIVYWIRHNAGLLVRDLYASYELAYQRLRFLHPDGGYNKERIVAVNCEGIQAQDELPDKLHVVYSQYRDVFERVAAKPPYSLDYWHGEWWNLIAGIDNPNVKKGETTQKHYHYSGRRKG